MSSNDWYEPGLERVDGQCQRLKHKFKSHPRALGQSYKGHLWQSMKRSGASFILSIEYFIHALFPFWFKNLDMTEEQQRAAAGLVGEDIFTLNSDSSSEIGLDYRSSDDEFSTLSIG